MGDSKEGSEAWTRVPSISDVHSLENSLNELAGHDNVDRGKKAMHTREDSDDGVTSPLKTGSPSECRCGGANTAPIDSDATVRNQALSAKNDSSGNRLTPGDSEKLDEGDRSRETQTEIQPEGEDVQQGSSQQRGGWWSSLASSVKKAAEGVAKDIDEINDSFQNILSNIDDSDEEADATPSVLSPQPQHSPDSPRTAARRQEILSRLEGEDTELEAGLKAIDEQVEQLTGGLSRAIGSLWGSAREAVTTGVSFSHRVAERMESAAKEMSSQVEAGVRDSQRGIAQAAMTTSRVTTSFAQRAESGLEALGKRAVDLLDPELPAEAPETSFQYYWHACGGQQSYEEVEDLSNESARQCNFLRNRMAPAAKKRLEDLLTHLSPILDLQSGSRPREEEGSIAQGANETFDRVHAAVTQIRDEGILQAERLAGGQGLRDAQKGGDDLQGNVADVDVAKLERLCSEGGKQLAMLCGVCIECLLALGRSLSSQVRFGRPADDDVQWPNSAAHKAQLLHAQGKLLLRDLEALAEAFASSIKEAASVAALRVPAEKLRLLEAASALCSTLELNCNTALMRVQESVQGLLYIVVLTEGGFHAQGGLQQESA